MSRHPKLMIPGPVDIWEETLAALGEPVLPYYGGEWEPIYRETLSLLARVFQTENDIFILSAPGSGAIETGIASLYGAGDLVAVMSNGPFAGRAVQILRAHHCRVLEVEGAWGRTGDVDEMRQALERNPDVAGVVVVANETGTGVRNPVRELAALAHARDLPILVDAVSALGGYDLPVDAWGLDLVCSASNKALEIPPGLGLISVSQRAWERIERVPAEARRGWYYHLSTWKPFREVGGGGRVSPATTATSLVVALRASLRRILEEETLAGHWARYAWAQRVLRAGLTNMGFEMLVPAGEASPTVTTFWKREDMADGGELQRYLLEEHGIMIAGALGHLAGRVLRVGHMGKASTPEYLLPCLLGIEAFVRRVKGVDLPIGAGLVGLEDGGEGAP